MAKYQMNSRQRMLSALACQEGDYPPCSFMLYGGLRSECQTHAEFIERQVAMGLDAYIQLPPRPPIVVNDHYNLHGLPVSYDPRVQIREWVEHPADEEWPILVKEYDTPTGKLRNEVRKTEDWPWGDHVPFLDDYIIPRARKFLVTKGEDLEALQFLLTPPSEGEIAAFKADSGPAQAQAQYYDLLVAGGWGVGADLIGWLCGLENMIFLSYDQPDLFRELLEIISAWNQKRMEVVLAAGIDLYIKRAWYENLDFFTPSTWRQYIFPILKSDVDLTHEWGSKFGYLITASCMPLLEMIAEAGVDVLIGVDPMRWDLQIAKQRVGGRVCLWGGVNGHLIVEQGLVSDVRAEVKRALETLAPGGGFILSPVDNVREHTSRSRENVQALIEEWRRLRG